MTDVQPHYARSQGFELLNAIVEQYGPLFSIDQAYVIGVEQALSKSRTRQVLSAMSQSGWIARIKRGVYVVQSPIYTTENLHPFAIAGALVQPVAISHWSALAHHGLTTQIPPMVQASTPSQVVTPEMRKGESFRPRGRAVWQVFGIEFEFIQIRQKHFFGFNQEWVTPWHRVLITDLERTLLDMVVHPENFGGIAVGIETLSLSISSLDIDGLVAYTIRYDMGSVIKRLGWILESLGVSVDRLVPLQVYPVKNDYLLDVRGPQNGEVDRHWNIILNLTGAQSHNG